MEQLINEGYRRVGASLFLFKDNKWVLTGETLYSYLRGASLEDIQKAKAQIPELPDTESFTEKEASEHLEYAEEVLKHPEHTLQEISQAITTLTLMKVYIHGGRLSRVFYSDVVENLESLQYHQSRMTDADTQFHHIIEKIKAENLYIAGNQLYKKTGLTTWEFTCDARKFIFPLLPKDVTEDEVQLVLEQIPKIFT